MKRLLIQLTRLYLACCTRVQLAFLGVASRKNHKVILLEIDLQSTAMYLMSSLGVIERADYAVFMDPGAENRDACKYVQWLKAWSRASNGIPLLIVNEKSSWRSFASVRDFTKKAGDSSEEDKIALIIRMARRAYGLSRNPPPVTEVWLGATLEKIDKVKFAPVNRIVFVYPFLNFKVSKYDIEQVRYTEVLSRAHCLRWMEANGFQFPLNNIWN